MKVKLDEHAFAPTRAHATDAGLDIRADHSAHIFSGSSEVFFTGVHIQLPKNTAGLLVSKSGLNVKFGLTSTGLIDEGYTGEIVVKIDNNHGNDYFVKRGDKISQLVIIPVLYEDVEIVDELESGDRGDDGFGSTGR